MVGKISPQELKEWLESGKEFQLLDVRETWEYEAVHLPRSLLIPLGQLPLRLAELDPKNLTVALCHHGVRSLQAAYLLSSQGFEDVRNLSGGIDAYAREANPTLPRY